MTVYVDDMYLSPIGQFRRMKMSHMIADTEAELHAMAALIGMRKEWYQGDHYDVALGRRRLAIGHGTVEITYRQCALMCSVRKQTGKLPKAEVAEKIWKELRELRKEY